MHSAQAFSPPGQSGQNNAFPPLPNQSGQNWFSFARSPELRGFAWSDFKSQAGDSSALCVRPFRNWEIKFCQNDDLGSHFLKPELFQMKIFGCVHLFSIENEHAINLYF